MVVVCPVLVTAWQETPHLGRPSSARLAPSWHHLTSPARAMALPQPTQAKHESHGRWTAMLPLLTPYDHMIQHIFDTSQCTALLSDRSPPPVRNSFHTVYTDQNIGGIPCHGMRTPEACNRHWLSTSAHSPGIGECVPVWHGAPPTLDNTRLFECTSHGNLGRAEYTFAFPHPCDALLGPTSDGSLTCRQTRHKHWAES